MGACKDESVSSKKIDALLEPVFNAIKSAFDMRFHHGFRLTFDYTSNNMGFELLLMKDVICNI